jgi:hypothetical protein
MNPASAAKQRELAYFAQISGKQTSFGIENKGTLHRDTDHVKVVQQNRSRLAPAVSNHARLW